MFQTFASAMVVSGCTSVTAAARYSVVVLRLSKSGSQTAKTVVNICTVLWVGKQALIEHQERRWRAYTICLQVVRHFGK